MGAVRLVESKATDAGLERALHVEEAVATVEEVVGMAEAISLVAVPISLVGVAT